MSDDLKSELWKLTVEARNLRAENEALRKDAERYRWLRNDALQMLVDGPIVVLADKWGGLVAQGNGSHISIDGEALDKNIDAAMWQEGER